MQPPSEDRYLIIELVAQIRVSGVILNQISLGWLPIKAFLNLKGMKDVYHQNINSSAEVNRTAFQRESKSYSNHFNYGSPTYLLMNESIENLNAMQTQIKYRTFTFKVLVLLLFLLMTFSLFKETFNSWTFVGK